MRSHEDHVASRRVAENIGMREERRTLLEGDYPAILYAADLERSATVTRTPEAERRIARCALERRVGCGGEGRPRERA
jgi:hypothetical protein